jgi:REP element-mobilizing transposase RayT
MGMPRALRTPHFSGAVFHITSRGNAKQDVFFDDDDYRTFLSILRELKARCLFKLYAYCLMPNHVHLLIEVAQVSQSIILQYLLSRYGVFLNLKTSRVGHVFQGRFRSTLCDRDAYLLTLVRYIHANPVRAGLVKDPGDWPWSSHGEYLGRNDPISDPQFALALLSGDPDRARRSYLGLMKQEGLTGKIETYRPALGRALLSADALRVLGSIGETAAGAHGATLAAIREGSRESHARVARKALIHLASKRGFRPAQLAEFLDCSDWAIRKSLIAA